jgi:NOL1/NOP2/sun family putative RNA methylase
MTDVRSSLPTPFLEKLPTFLSPKQVTTVVSALSKGSPISFRINPLKAVRETVISKLNNTDFMLQEIPWYEDAFVVTNRSKTDLLQTTAVSDGHIYLQGLSSMIPVIVLDPKPGEIILDMAAAPGSKTTQIAAFMENTGELSANDKSRERLYKLKPLLENQGVTNTKVINVSGEYLWKKLPEYFDRVLLDAPCSMEGRFLATEPKSYEDWSPKKVKLLSTIQKYLLRSAISCTKVGGTIVYSTCTLSPEENEEVIDWILEKEKGNIEVELIRIAGLNTMPGLTSWKNKVFDKELEKTVRILPSERMEGFYVAKFKKLQSNLSSLL